MIINKARVTGGFWERRKKLAADRTLWEQLAILKGRREGLREDQISHAVENFQIAARESNRPYQGTVCNDSEIGKWIEAASYSLMHYPDPELEREIDELIRLILLAQMEDGYVNTFFQAKFPEERLRHYAFNCELYNMGHLMEAAAAYFTATGKRAFLDGMCRLAELLCREIGPGPEQAHVYDGHAEIELGLLALYRVTGEERYLDLAAYFVHERGRQPSFLLHEKSLTEEDPKITDKWFGLDHHQAHMPVTEQEKADGHAVKVTYLFAAAAEIVQLGRDRTGKLWKAVNAVWENMVRHRMYITGAIGSQGYGERFTVDDDLPNDRGYAETCASAGIAMWGRRMLKLSHDSRFADTAEKAIYNGMLAGWSLDGDRYFYVNMLHCKRSVMSYRQDQAYMDLQRQPWFYCACCPSNILRIVCNIEKYLFSADGDILYVDGYATAEIAFRQGEASGKIEMETDYPYDGAVCITFSGEAPVDFTLALRKPGWCTKAVLRMHDEPVQAEMQNGYYQIHRIWMPGDTVQLDMEMNVQYMTADPAMWENRGYIAATRGPLIYCAESMDQDGPLDGLMFDPKGKSRLHTETIGTEQMVMVEAEGYRQKQGTEAYQAFPPEVENVNIRAIPYFAWNNRGESDMDVWLPVWSSDLTS